MIVHVIEKFNENVMTAPEWEVHFLGDGLACRDVGSNDTSLDSLCIYLLEKQCCVYWRGRSDHCAGYHMVCGITLLLCRVGGHPTSECWIMQCEGGLVQLSACLVVVSLYELTAIVNSLCIGFDFIQPLDWDSGRIVAEWTSTSD
jgi:hypothetical protein